jgi:hypothetical protein
MELEWTVLLIGTGWSYPLFLIRRAVSSLVRVKPLVKAPRAIAELFISSI